MTVKCSHRATCLGMVFSLQDQQLTNIISDDQIRLQFDEGCQSKNQTGLKICSIKSICEFIMGRHFRVMIRLISRIQNPSFSECRYLRSQIIQQTFIWLSTESKLSKLRQSCGSSNQIQILALLLRNHVTSDNLLDPPIPGLSLQIY